MDMSKGISDNPVHTLEMQEIIQKLKDNGFEDLVTCLLDNENDCYTKRGRLNKSSTSRKMGWKSKQLEDALQGMREILGDEFGDLIVTEDNEDEEDE